MGGWGQSQATEEQIRRAHAVTRLTAIQSEYSIMERMFEKDVIPACEELGIGFVPTRQHPREPAPAGPTHCIREGEKGRHSGADLPRVDAAQEGLHCAHPGIAQARADPGEPRRC